MGKQKKRRKKNTMWFVFTVLTFYFWNTYAIPNRKYIKTISIYRMYPDEKHATYEMALNKKEARRYLEIEQEFKKYNISKTRPETLSLEKVKNMSETIQYFTETHGIKAGVKLYGRTMAIFILTE